MEEKEARDAWLPIDNDTELKYSSPRGSFGLLRPGREKFYFSKFLSSSIGLNRRKESRSLRTFNRRSIATTVKNVLCSPTDSITGIASPIVFDRRSTLIHIKLTGSELQLTIEIIPASDVLRRRINASSLEGGWRFGPSDRRLYDVIREIGTLSEERKKRHRRRSFR